MPRTLSVSATLLALAAACAAADQAPVIVVTAERGESELQRSPVSIDLVTDDDIRDRGYVTNGADWLRGLAGVNVINRYGGIDGGTADVRVRGVDPAFTQILVDGIPLNDTTAIGGDYNPSFVNPAGVERVEVLKGAQSGLYGSRAIGGVINYITIRPTEEQHERFRLTGGSFHTGGFEASATGPLGRSTGYAVGLSGLSSAGFSSQTDIAANGDPSGHEPDGVHRFSGSARIENHPDRQTTLYATGFLQRVEQRYDELGPEDGLPEIIGHTRRLTAGAKHDSGSLIVSGDIAWTANERANLTNFGPPPTFPAATAIYRGSEVFAQSRVEVRPVEHLRLAAGADWRSERAAQGFELQPDDWNDRARTTGGYVQGGWEGDRLGVSLVGREDQHSAFGDHASGRAALAVWPVEHVFKLRSSVANGYRAPSLYQLHGFGDFGFGFTFQGNPDLKPETAIAYEVGADWYPAAGIEVGTTAFRTNYRRKIVYDGVATPNTYVNLDSDAHVRGVEAAVRSANIAASGVDLSLHLTMLRSDDGAGNDLAYVPSATGGGRVTVHQQPGRWAFWESVGVERSTGFATGLLGAGVVGGYTLVDAAVGTTIDRTWELSVRVENALRETYAVTTSFGNAYSSEPRAVFVNLAASF